MPRMFMSYRRADTISESGRIHDHLEREFGGRNVFKDVDDIQPGFDFRKVLDEEVAKCEVLLVIIGPSWATSTDGDGNLRLHNPDDFVRIEVESGLKRGDEVLVIPVLVNNANMPSVNQLPASLHDLTYRNAVIIRNDPDFNRDMRRLIDYIRRYTRSTRKNVSSHWIRGGVMVAALLVIGLLVLSSLNPSAPITSTATPDTIEASPTTQMQVVATPQSKKNSDLFVAAQTASGNANYSEAVSLYSQIIDADPNFAPAYLGRALAYSSGFGDYPSAIDDLEKAIELDPQYAEAYRYLGQFQYYVGEMDDVENHLRRALQLNPADAAARLSLAEYYINFADYDKAEEQYDALLDAPESLDTDQLYEAWLGKGSMQSASGNYEDAELSYDNAITIDGERPEAYAAMGELLSYQEDYEGALSYLDTVIDKLPDDPYNYYNRGIANLELENHTQAIADFDRALQLSPNFIDAYIGRGRVYNEVGDYEAAVADFNQAIRRDDTYAEAYYWRGITHFYNEQYSLAIDDFSISIDLEYRVGESYAYRGLSYLYSDPEFAQDDLETALEYDIDDWVRYEVLYQLGWLEMENDKSSDALEFFAEAIAFDPTLDAAYVGESTIFMDAASNADNDRDARNNWLSALDTLSRGIDATEENAYLYYRRGVVNQEIGSIDDDEDYWQAAVDDYETAVENDDQMIDAYIHLAELALWLDDYSDEDAFGYAEAALALDDTDPYALSTLASVYQAMSDYDAARELYQQAIDNSRDDDERETYQALYDAVP